MNELPLSPKFAVDMIVTAVKLAVRPPTRKTKSTYNRMSLASTEAGKAHNDAVAWLHGADAPFSFAQCLELAGINHDAAMDHLDHIISEEFIAAMGFSVVVDLKEDIC